MKVAILALGSTGDVTPCAALGGALARAGHRVCLASHADFAPLADSQGLDFIPAAPSARQMAQDAGISLAGFIRPFVTLAAKLAGAFTVPEVLEADLVLNQLPGGLFGRDITEKSGGRLVGLACLPILPTSAYPAIGWPSLPFPAYSRFSYRVAERIVWALFGRAVNRWRSASLGLRPLGFEEYFDNRYPVLGGFSPRLLPPPADWGDRVRVTGYWHLPAPDWQPPEKLLKFLQDGPAPVFVGFGSMAMRNPSRTLAIFLRALEARGLRAVLHAGWANLTAASLPSSVFPIQYASYDWLFPRMSALVIHGGVGTVHCAARSGVPTLVVPFLFDQFGWGKRLHQLQVGPRPLPYRQLTTARLIARLGDLTGNPVYRRESAALGSALQTEDGLAAALNEMNDVVFGALRAPKTTSLD